MYPNVLNLCIMRLRTKYFRVTPQAVRRFKSQIEMADNCECLLWCGGSSNGYGQICTNGVRVYVHRFAYAMYHGHCPPRDKVVRHTCDNKACVAKAHLILGTQLENVRDAWERGRMKTKNGGRGSYTKMSLARYRKLMQDQTLDQP